MEMGAKEMMLMWSQWHWGPRKGHSEAIRKVVVVVV